MLCTGASPHRCVEFRSELGDQSVRQCAHLVVETALLIEEVEELGVCFTSPEVKVANLEVTPDCASRD